MGRDFVEKYVEIAWSCDLCDTCAYTTSKTPPVGWVYPASFLDVDKTGVPFALKKQCLCAACASFLVAAAIACLYDRTPLGDSLARFELDKARGLHRSRRGT
jgi:hypothetical protein